MPFSDSFVCRRTGLLVTFVFTSKFAVGTVTPPDIVRHDQGSPASAAAAEPDHFAPAVQTTILTHDSPPLPPAGHLPNARVSSLGGTVSSVTLSGPATLKRPPSQSPAKHIVRWPSDVDV
ncbi:hypothetical protein DIPPA_15281 [Diplonema papillatum]|nr:hypothetical protein DIPPA_15281 [Diplonema papillatum]